MYSFRVCLLLSILLLIPVSAAQSPQEDPSEITGWENIQGIEVETDYLTVDYECIDRPEVEVWIRPEDGSSWTEADSFTGENSRWQGGESCVLDGGSGSRIGRPIDLDRTTDGTDVYDVRVWMRNIGDGGDGEWHSVDGGTIEFGPAEIEKSCPGNAACGQINQFESHDFIREVAIEKSTPLQGPGSKFNPQIRIKYLPSEDQHPYFQLALMNPETGELEQFEDLLAVAPRSREWAGVPQVATINDPASVMADTAGLSEEGGTESVSLKMCVDRRGETTSEIAGDCPTLVDFWLEHHGDEGWIAKPATADTGTLSDTEYPVEKIDGPDRLEPGEEASYSIEDSADVSGDMRWWVLGPLKSDNYGNFNYKFTMNSGDEIVLQAHSDLECEEVASIDIKKEGEDGVLLTENVVINEGAECDSGDIGDGTTGPEPVDYQTTDELFEPPQQIETGERVTFELSDMVSGTPRTDFFGQTWYFDMDNDGTFEEEKPGIIVTKKFYEPGEKTIAATAIKPESENAGLRQTTSVDVDGERIPEDERLDTGCGTHSYEEGGAYDRFSDPNSVFDAEGKMVFEEYPERIQTTNDPGFAGTVELNIEEIEGCSARIRLIKKNVDGERTSMGTPISETKEIKSEMSFTLTEANSATVEQGEYRLEVWTTKAPKIHQTLNYYKGPTVEVTTSDFEVNPLESERPASEAPDFFTVDQNGDGSVDSSDLEMLNLESLPSDLYNKEYDYNCDNSHDRGDTKKLKDWVRGEESLKQCTEVDSWTATKSPDSAPSSLTVDLNDDGVVTAKDAEILFNRVSEGEIDPDTDSYDYNCDGEVTAGDASMLDYWLNGEEELEICPEDLQPVDDHSEVPDEFRVDLNGDDQADETDVTMLRNFVEDGEVDNPGQYDYTCNGQLSARDVEKLGEWIKGNSELEPCESDSAPDEIQITTPEEPQTGTTTTVEAAVPDESMTEYVVIVKNSEGEEIKRETFSSAHASLDVSIESSGTYTAEIYSSGILGDALSFLDIMPAAKESFSTAGYEAEATVNFEDDGYTTGDTVTVSYTKNQPGSYRIEIEGAGISTSELSRESETLGQVSAEAESSGEITARVVAPGNLWNPFNNDQTVDTARIEIGESDPSGLEASIRVSPEEPVTGDAIELEGQVPETVQDDVETYSWDFNGDNQYERQGRTTTVEFEDAGEKTVELKVTGTGGSTSTASSSFTVEDSQSTEPNGFTNVEAEDQEYVSACIMDFQDSATFDAPYITLGISEAGTVEALLNGNIIAKNTFESSTQAGYFNEFDFSGVNAGQNELRMRLLQDGQVVETETCGTADLNTVPASEIDIPEDPGDGQDRQCTYELFGTVEGALESDIPRSEKKVYFGNHFTQVTEESTFGWTNTAGCGEEITLEYREQGETLTSRQVQLPETGGRVDGIQIQVDREDRDDRENIHPEISVSPEQPEWGSSVELTAHPSGDYSYQWDLNGDNQYEKDGRSATKTLDEQEELSIKLKVSGANVEATATRTVEVEGPALSSSLEVSKEEITPDERMRIVYRTSDDIAENGYKLIVENPSGEKVYIESREDDSGHIPFTPRESPEIGTYTARLVAKEGFLSSILQTVFGPEAESKFRVIEVSENLSRWQKYCEASGYDPMSASGRATCIIEEVGPECFTENPRIQCREIANSVCEYYLGNEFNPDTGKCGN